MKRNMNRDFLKKLIGIEKNGYRFDIANYLHNPAYGYDYPRFRKVIEETEDYTIYRDVYYFKYYDGTGEYKVSTYKAPKTNETWVVTKELDNTVLTSANRFNLNTLLSFC